MRFAVVGLVLLLSGCGFAAGYQPYVQDIIDPAALASDELACRDYALAYQTPLNLNSILTGAAQGGTKNVASAAINPIIPVLGAVGGGTSELLSQLGVLNDDQRRVFLRCLEHRGERSRAYNVMDPNF